MATAVSVAFDSWMAGCESSRDEYSLSRSPQGSTSTATEASGPTATSGDSLEKSAEASSPSAVTAWLVLTWTSWSAAALYCRSVCSQRMLLIASTSSSSGMATGPLKSGSRPKGSPPRTSRVLSSW